MKNEVGELFLMKQDLKSFVSGNCRDCET